MIMKKYATCLIILLVMQFLQGSDNKTMVRWGDDKELAVAWYLFKNPKKISDFKIGKYEGSDFQIKEPYSQLNIEEHLEKLKVAALFNVFPEKNKDITGKIFLIFIGYEEVECNRLIQRRMHEFFLKAGFSFGIYGEQQKMLNKSIELYMQNSMIDNEVDQKVDQKVDQFDCKKYLLHGLEPVSEEVIRPSEEMQAFLAKQEKYLNTLNKNFEDSIIKAVKLLKIQKNCILELDMASYLKYQFAKMQSDRFFHIKDGFRPSNIEFGMKDQFEQDLILFINGILKDENERVVNDKRYQKYFLSKYEKYFSGAFVLQGGFEISSPQGWENCQSNVEKALQSMQKEIESFKEFVKEHLNNTKKSLDYFFVISDLLHNWRNNNYDVVYDGGLKGDSSKHSCSIPLHVLNYLSKKGLVYIKKLIKSNNNYVEPSYDFSSWFDSHLFGDRSSNNKLIKFNDLMVEDWFKYSKNIRNYLKITELKLDVESNPATFSDKCIIYLSLLINCLLPDLLLYYCSHAGSMAVNCFALSEFLGSVHIMAPIMYGLCLIGMKSDMEYIPTYPCLSYGIGHYIFPWLDGTFNSHVKLLKKFFGEDGLRKRIRQSNVFRLSSALNWILSFVGNKLFAYTKVLGLLTHCIRISVYYFISCYLNYIHCDDPMHRGYYNAIYDYVGPYMIKHLKKPSCKNQAV